MFSNSISDTKKFPIFSKAGQPSCLTHEISNLLKKCDGLKKFLGETIKFLESNDNKHHAEQVISYLRKEIDYLPKELEDKKLEMSSEERSSVSALLDAYGLTGKSEVPCETIKKLQALNHGLEREDYMARLEDWVMAGSDQEYSARTQAMEKIKECLDNDGKELSLTQLGLTTIPPLDLLNLEKLILKGNRITSLAGLSLRKERLETLDLSQNQITSFEGMQQFNALKILSFSDNRLTSFAGMPKLNALKELYLYKNRLTSFKDMPELNALVKLNVNENQMSSLKWIPKLNALKELYVINNQLTSISELLVQQLNKLTTLNLSGNQLTSFVGIPPLVLANRNAYIDLTSNQLSLEAIFQISSRVFQAAFDIDIAGSEIDEDVEKPLDQEVVLLFGENAAQLWKPYANTDDGERLATLLRRLHQSVSFTGSSKNESIAELKAILERMLEDETFRKCCFIAIHGSDEDCHDNVQRIFDELRMLLADPTTKKNATLDMMVNFLKGRLAAQLIDEYVVKRVGGVEPTESGMLLKKELSQHLGLPISFRAIKFGHFAKVSNNLALHIKQAVEYVLTQLTNKRLGQEMLATPTYVEFLKASYPVTFEAHNLLWLDALEQASKCEPQIVEDKNQIVEDNESLLHAARNTPFSDGGKAFGKQFTEWKIQAETMLLEKIIDHVIHNLTMSPAERRQWEINTLTTNRDWINYLKQENTVVKVAEEPDVLISEKLDPQLLSHWTALALQKSGVKGFENVSV